MTPINLNEKETRYSIIDPLLKKAGWNLVDHTQVRFEIPVQDYDKTRVTGFSDYCLYKANGDVLAVIEAKRASRDPRVGKQQVLEYVTEIEKKQSFRPFAFMSNGDDIKANKYVLSISRYKPVEYEEVVYEKHDVIMEKVLSLGKEIPVDINSIKKMLSTQ